MTGYGEARVQAADALCTANVRSVNNRFLKVTVNLPETHASLEFEVEKLVRDRAQRGTIAVVVRIESPQRPFPHRLNRDAVQNYLSQLNGLVPIDAATVGQILALPGVVEEYMPNGVAAREWPLVRQTVEQALTALEAMRRGEGVAMKTELAQLCCRASALVDDIEHIVPENVQEYRDRLHQRLSGVLAEYQLNIEPEALIREVALFADRCDVAEEVARLRSHMTQFGEMLDGKESLGRQLDFLAQEMNREANTIGAKANNARIAQRVVELKTEIERMRELIQNVE